jgi:hypothetical protein
MRTWVRGSDRGFSDHNQAGDPVRAGGSVPQGEHGAERVSDHWNPVEPERIDDVIDQSPRVLAHLPWSEDRRVR